MTLETIVGIIISIVTAIGGWEAIKYLINRKSEKRKSEAEADSAATSVIKQMQEAYQVFISDAKGAIEDDHKYISALKEERNELRKRIDETDEKVRDLQREVARNGRMVEGLRPFICGRLECKRRLAVAISAKGEVSDVEPKDIEPLDMKDM